MTRLLRPWCTLAVLAGAGLLAACDPAPPTPKATDAAASTPEAPSGQAAPATGAVQGLGGDAAIVAQSAEKAESLPSHAQPSTAQASPLDALKVYVGTYPSDGHVSFLEQGVLADRLKQLLGQDYTTLLANLRTASPLQQDQGRWFITGNRPHEGGMEVAAVVIDAPHNAIRVWMLHEGKVQEWSGPAGVQMPWPEDVQTMIDNQKSKS